MTNNDNHNDKEEDLVDKLGSWTENLFAIFGFFMIAIILLSAVIGVVRNMLFS